MVASGYGISVLPAGTLSGIYRNEMVVPIPFPAMPGHVFPKFAEMAVRWLMLGRRAFAQIAAPVEPPGQHRQGQKRSWQHQHYKVGRQVCSGV